MKPDRAKRRLSQPTMPWIRSKIRSKTCKRWTTLTNLAELHGGVHEIMSESVSIKKYLEIIF